jgi:hypothetical protein
VLFVKETILSQKSIIQFFQNGGRYLIAEEAVAYLSSEIIQNGKTYAHRITQNIYPETGFRISESILHKATIYLESQGYLQRWVEKCERRGRPQHFFDVSSSISQNGMKELQFYADFWRNNYT